MFLSKLRSLLHPQPQAELKLTLKRIVGQKLIGVTQDKDGTIQLHFEDWVVFVKDPFPSPIIERINWERKEDRGYGSS